MMKGLASLALLVILAALALGLAALFVAAFIGSDAWKPIVGFLIAAVVIVAIDRGVRGSSDSA